MRRCLKMAAEEPQQQKQEPLGSDSEGTDQGRTLRPGLAGVMLGNRFPRRPGAKRADGPFLPRRRLPSPSQWKELPPRPPAGRAVGRAVGRGGSSPAALPPLRAL